MDVERIIDEIEQQEMFEAPDIRPLSASDISAANRRHDEMLGGWPTHVFSMDHRDRGCPTRRGFRRVGTTNPDGFAQRSYHAIHAIWRTRSSAFRASLTSTGRRSPRRSGDSCSSSTVLARAPDLVPPDSVHIAKLLR